MSPPIPNPDRSRPPIRTLLIVLGVLLIALGGLCYALHRTSTPPTPTPAPTASSFEFSETTSEGGREDVRGHAAGPNLNLHGGTINADDLKLSATVMDFETIGRITGGAVAGSFKVSAGTLRLLAWCSGILGVLCIVSGVWKIRSPIPDYVHGAGMLLGGVLMLIGAFVPEVLGWIGLGSIAAILATHVFPSLAAKAGAQAEATLGKLADRVNPDALAIAESKLPESHRVVLAKARAKRAKA